MRQATRYLSAIVVLALLFLAVGCSRDPLVRRQKYYDRGKRYYDQGKYSEAVIEFANANRIDSGYPEAHYWMAQAYAKLGGYQMAYGELIKTLELQPRNLEAHLDLGELLLSSREEDKARSEAELVLGADPNRSRARALLANCLGAKGDIAGALREMEKAVDLDPNNSNLRINKSIFQAGTHDIAGAEQSLHEAIRLSPRSAAPPTALARMYQALGRFAEAEKQYQAAIAAEPAAADSWLSLAQLYVQQGNLTRAEQTAAQAKATRKDDPRFNRMLAEYFVATNQMDRAFAEFQSLHQEHPGDKALTKILIQLLIQRGRIDEARPLNARLLKDNKNDADAQVLLAQIFLALNRPADAVTLLDNLVAVEPDNAAAHYYLATALLETGAKTRAEDEFQTTVHLRPGEGPADQALIEMARRSGNIELLYSRANQMVNAQPFVARWYVYRARAEIARQQGAQAEADLRKAIALNAKDPEAYVVLAGWCFSNQRLAEAEKLYAQALQQYDKSTDALQGLFQVYVRQGQLDKALAFVDAQIKAAPNISQLYLLRGVVLFAKKDNANAETALNYAIDLDRHNIEAYSLLGQYFVARGLRDQALRVYNAGVAANPQEARFYVTLGALESQRGNWKQAEELYKRALRIDPNYPTAANNLAHLMLERGESVDVAVSWAQLARRGMPDSPVVADTLGWAYYQKGAYTLALDVLEEAVKKSPKNAIYHYHLGLAYQGAHDRERARVHLQKALQLSSQSRLTQEIQQALAKLDQG